jgi:hypothetical protein
VCSNLRVSVLLFMLRSVKEMFNEDIDSSNISKQLAQKDEIDGHPVYKWDQEMILQMVFSTLDKGGKGYLTIDDISAIANNKIIHGLLRFTVFWTFIKKKKWDFFITLFDDETNKGLAAAVSLSSAPAAAVSAVSDHSRSNKQALLVPLVNRADGTTLREHVAAGSGARNAGSAAAVLYCGTWLAAAARIAVCGGVQARHIRSDIEHTEIVRNGKRRCASGSMSIPEREFWLARHLVTGDCVWALHHAGPVWLPAVITKVSPSAQLSANHRSSSSLSPRPQQRLHQGCPYQYDLRFILTERDLQRVRTMAASRALLELPSQMVEVNGGCLRPQPFDTERAACAYAFDLCDAVGMGAVELDALVATLYSAEFKKVVETSLALQIIFGERRTQQSGEKDCGATTPAANTAVNKESAIVSVAKLSGCGSHIDCESIPSLRTVFTDTFSQPSSESAATTPTSGELRRKKNHDSSDSYEDDEEEDENTMNNEETSQNLHGGTNDTNQKRVIDFISKADFLEFCDAVVNLKVYSIKSGTVGYAS